MCTAAVCFSMLLWLPPVLRPSFQAATAAHCGVAGSTSCLHHKHVMSSCHPSERPMLLSSRQKAASGILVSSVCWKCSMGHAACRACAVVSLVSHKVPRSHSSCASPYCHCMRHTLGTAPAHVTPSLPDITNATLRRLTDELSRAVSAIFVHHFWLAFVSRERGKYLTQCAQSNLACWSQPQSLLSACCLMLQAHQNCNATSAATPNSVQTAGLALLQQLRQCCCFFQPHSWPSVGHSGSPVGAWQELLASPFCCC